MPGFWRLFLIGALAILMAGCDSRPQHFEEQNGRWLVTDLLEGSPQYSFKPLNSSWEPHPPPTENCAIFFGKIGDGTHIGVFLNPVKPEVSDDIVFDYLPREMILHYLSNTANEHRAAIAEPQPFGDGLYAASENSFTNLGASIRAFEAFVVIPTSQNIVSFTFKRRMEVDTRDFRREKGLERLLENSQKTQLEHQEFLDFVRSFSVTEAQK